MPVGIYRTRCCSSLRKTTVCLICIVIGVVGPDNYCAERDCEIVYGRRWRVES